MAGRSRKDPFQPVRPRRRSRRHVEERSEQASNSDSASRPRRRRRAPFILLALLLIVCLLPNLVGWLRLQDRVLGWALSDLQGKVTVGQATLGWFQAISLKDVVVTDATGNEMLTIESIQTSRPLFAFLTGSDYGEVSIDRPLLYLRIDSESSNLEHAISRYVAGPLPSPMDEPPKDTSFAMPKMEIRINDGGAVVSSSADSQTWQIDSLTAAIALSQAQAPLAATAQCQAVLLKPDSSGRLVVEESGKLLLKSAIDVDAPKLTFSTANVELETQHFPLSILAPFCQRFLGPSRFGGAADGKLVASWNSTNNEIDADVQAFAISNATAFIPQVLNNDRFFVEQIGVRGSLQMSPKRIAADGFVVETDFGRLNASGQFDPKQMVLSSGQTAAADADLNVEGFVDVAKLVQRLPATFRLHEDVAVESGTIRFSAGHKNEADVRRLVVNLDTANIRGRRGNRAIVWQQPLRLVGKLVQRGGQFEIEQLQCISEFLNISGSANAQEGMFGAEGNLAILAERIRQFADIGEVDFDGNLKGQFGWKVVGQPAADVTQIANRPIQIAGELFVANPALEYSATQRWNPKELKIRLSGSGQWLQELDASKLALSQAGVELMIDDERAVVSLAHPVEDAFSNRRWSLNTRLQGQASAWLAHLRNVFDPGRFDANGAMDVAGVTVLDGSTVRFENGQYEITQLQFDGYGASIREDRVVGAFTANYGLETGDVDVVKATLLGSAISASAENLKLSFVDAWQIDGSAAWQADINRVAEWFSLSPNPDSIHWYGAAGGTATFRSGVDGTAASFQAQLSDVVATQRVVATSSDAQIQTVASAQRMWLELWREGRIDLSGQVKISDDFDQFQFDQLSARSESIDVDAKGSLSDLSGAMTTSFEGQYRPDFRKINDLLAAYTGQSIELSGNSTYPFRIQGPLFSTTQTDAWVPGQLVVQAMAGWESGKMFGLPIGKSDLRLDLQQQVVALQAVNVPVSNGVAHLQPQLDMRSGQAILVHGQSEILNRVELTPEICRDCLSFVAPWLSDTTNAKGIFSAQIDGLRMPLEDPLAARARGTLLVEELTIESGPLAEQLLTSVAQIQRILKPDSRERQLSKWLRVERQSVPVVIENRRVFHDGIKFSHNELVIRTSGSVGIEDQSIDLVASIPIADQWIEGNRYLAGLKGQSLSIPIGGTVSRPSIDPSRINQLSRQLIQNAAQGAIGNAVSDKLNPKLDEANRKLTGEVNKLQNRFQDKLGGFLNEKLGVEPAQSGGTGSQVPQPTPSAGQRLENRVNDQLKKGLDKLFGG